MLMQIALALCLLLAGSTVALALNTPLPIDDGEFESVLTGSIDHLFRDLSRNSGTDKTNDHRYDYLYSRWLAPVRNEKLHLLEIGLGCNMREGPGHSLKLWRQYLPYAYISFLEYDIPCATKFQTDVEQEARGKLYMGDQADPAVLNLIFSDSKRFGGFDVIIDDGGHTANQMTTSFKTLWGAVKPGGLYMVEDTCVNYAEHEFGSNNTFVAIAKQAIDIAQCRMFPDMAQPSSAIRQEFRDFCAQHPMDIISVECMPEACALLKGKPRTMTEGPDLRRSRSNKRGRASDGPARHSM